MDTRHIKSAKIMSADGTLKAKVFEFPNDDQWYILFEVTDAFKIAFIAYMESRLHQMHIYRGVDAADAEEFGMTAHEVLMTTLYIDEGISWSFTDQGDLIMQEVNYETTDKEIPEQAWTYPVATLKRVLESM